MTGAPSGGGPSRRRRIVLAGIVHEVGEQPAQPRAGLEELALGAAGRDPELGRDLLVGGADRDEIGEQLGWEAPDWLALRRVSSTQRS